MWLHTHTAGGRRVIAFDGKTLRGARDAAGRLKHLLAGLCHTTGTVLAQLAVDGKTNEIPMLRTLLDGIDITGAVITADALHCQHQTAQAITARGGHYILTVLCRCWDYAESVGVRAESGCGAACLGSVPDRASA